MNEKIVMDERNKWLAYLVSEMSDGRENFEH